MAQKMGRYEQSFRIVRKLYSANLVYQSISYFRNKYDIYNLSFYLDNRDDTQEGALQIMTSTCNLNELEAEIDGFLLAHTPMLQVVESRNFNKNLLEKIKEWVLAGEKPWGICLKAYGLLESSLQQKLITEDFGRPLFEKHFGKDDGLDNNEKYTKYLAIALVSKKNNSSHKAHEVEISESEAIDYLCILNIVYTQVHKIL